jgi:hypothetical protein
MLRRRCVPIVATGAVHALQRDPQLGAGAAAAVRDLQVPARVVSAAAPAQRDARAGEVVRRRVVVDGLERDFVELGLGGDLRQSAQVGQRRSGDRLVLSFGFQHCGSHTHWYPNRHKR